jgi:hypothetical protein
MRIKGFKLDGMEVTRQVADFDPNLRYLNVFVTDDSGKVVVQNGMPVTETLSGRVSVEWDIDIQYRD